MQYIVERNVYILKKEINARFSHPFTREMHRTFARVNAPPVCVSEIERERKRERKDSLAFRVCRGRSVSVRKSSWLISVMTIAESKSAATVGSGGGGDNERTNYWKRSTAPRQVQIALAHRIIVSSSDAKFVSPDIRGTHEIIRYGMRVGKFLRKQSRMYIRSYDDLTAWRFSQSRVDIARMRSLVIFAIQSIQATHSLFFSKANLLVNWMVLCKRKQFARAPWLNETFQNSIRI